MQKENLKSGIIACILLFLFNVCLFSYWLLNQPENDVKGEVSGTIVSTVKLPPCPKCGYVECIYEDIDTMSDGTDKSIFDAIIYVGKERGLTEKQIDLLLTEYYL